MHCPTKNQHLFGHRCFLPPKNDAGTREVFRRFLHVETEPKFHWLAFEMMHAELPEGRLMVVRTVLPKKPIGVFFPGKRKNRGS